MRKNSVNRFIHLILIAAIFYASSVFAQFGLVTDFTHRPPFTLAAIQNGFDSDGDGLSDDVELSGMLPVLFLSPQPDMDVPSFNITSVAQPVHSFLWETDATVFEWVFGEGFTYKIGNKIYDRAWVSASGILSFGEPLYSDAPIIYPREKKT